MKILHIDDHLIIGKSVELTLEDIPEISEYKFIQNVEDLDTIIKSFDPSIVLLDIQLGDKNGLTIGEYIINHYKKKVIFFSGFDLVAYHEKALEIRAYGFIVKDASIEELITALKQVHFENKKVFPHSERLKQSYTTLSERERAILIRLAQGTTQSNIATELDIADKTVRNHLGSIYKKLNTHNAVESVAKATKLGLIKL
ncbi:response regulator transcription factor [Fundicoccus culcitae]|uniref:Response regulator transcription factor n=1 Tax=Fundicoccus culcitae TaxID=2969821 RepID=A0ABY5P5G5_9LACT|nr:response regulator transcription factor [Fundicoccus culcitae]UUX33615.1 response regulator transcription factor [Fundicoccus culcitae]